MAQYAMSSRTLAPVKPGRKHQKVVAPLRLCS
jgi:hypothetical protein